jgi:hypothetical protein
MVYLSDIINDNQPTRDAEVIVHPVVEEDDIGDSIDFLLDHLPVGGAKFTLDARRDQYMLIAKHDPDTNKITIRWATPLEIKEEEDWTFSQVYEFVHPSRRAGFEEWEHADYYDDED